MIQHPTYEILESIQIGQRSTIHRGRRVRDGLPVVLKSLSSDRPSADHAARFRREYEMLQHAGGEGSVAAYALEIINDRSTIVMEDGGESLRAVFAVGRLGMEEALVLAVRLASAIEAVHRQRIIHKDIKPANVVIQRATGAVRLVDFGISTRLSRETPSVRNVNVLEGTLLYMSPEQTGRMNRDVDHRTDLYSFGVLLYELFTGDVPFRCEEPVEVVHHHIARAPVPPQEADPSLPSSLSAVILKLLAKTGEDRYQSAQGVRMDLEEILCAWRAAALGGPVVIEGFLPGRNDTSDRFQIPQKLYGREAETAALLSTYERASQGRAELVLVGGYAGIGKTALVNEVHKPTVAHRGYFISGKFDQFQRDVPYASLVQALSELMGQILTESEARLAHWRTRLASALGSNGAVIAAILPNLTTVVGPQPPVPALPPSEAQNRFELTFLRFLKALAAPEHPLALFLDDLQWADPSSLGMLERLLSDSTAGHLLVIGTYRDNEVTNTHPLSRMEQALVKVGAKVESIVLRPLSLHDAMRLVADTLRCDTLRVAPLAQLAWERTGGNPFFLGQFLQSLHTERLIDFDVVAGAWCFKFEGIAARGVTDNVVDLMERKIRRLDPVAREALEIAACIGNRFELVTLAAVCGREPDALLTDLDDALQVGLVLPIGDGLLGTPAQLSLRFLHDRVQHAAYSCLGERDRRWVHLRIGRLLLASTPPERLEERVFDIVNQLNAGVESDWPENEREQLARLNLVAAKKARASAAAVPALHYARTGLSVLDAPFDAHYALAFELHLVAMDAEFLGASYAEVLARADKLLTHARTPLEKVRVHETRICAYNARSELMVAIEDGARALALLGIDLPLTVDFPRFLEGFEATRAELADRRAASLLEMPLATSEEAHAAMRVFVAIASSAYLVNPLLSLHVYTEMVKLCLRNGNSELSPFAFASYALIHTAVFGDSSTGNEYGDLALALSERWPTPRVKGRAYTQVGLWIKPWKTHLRDSLRLFANAVSEGLEGGDFEYVGYACDSIAMYSFYSGLPLDEIAREDARLLDIVKRCRLVFAEADLRICRQAVLNLLGQSADPTTLTGDEFDEDVRLAAVNATNNHSTLSLFQVLKTMLCYFFGDAASAVAAAEKGERFINAQLGQHGIVVLNFFQSLAVLALARGVSGDQKDALCAKAAKNQETLRRWADDAPMNVLHRYKLVDAERARVRGDDMDAVLLYEEAIVLATSNGFIHEAALGQELSGEHHLSRGREREGHAALTAACRSYADWGAVAKVSQLERHHSFLMRNKSATSATATGMSTTSTRSDGSSLLDLRTVMKASNAIAGELVLDKLLGTLMEILIENAGAERGILVIPEAGVLSIAASHAAFTPPLAGLPVPVEGSELLSSSIVHYVHRTGESVMLADAAAKGPYMKDAYVAKRRARSVLCSPLVNQGKIIAIVYLENNLAAGVFTADRLELLRLLSGQAALSIQNAMLFARLEEHSRTLEQRVEERTREFSRKNEELGATLKQLRDAQRRLVMQEKLASLGALTAGIAHELKNPLNFVNNFAELSADLAEDLASSVQKHGQILPPVVTVDMLDAIGLFRENVMKIKEHGVRANKIIEGMLFLSRGGVGERVPVDINAVVSESVHLAYHGARARGFKLDVRIHSEFDTTAGPVEVVAADIGRVFINIIDNACYAMQSKMWRGPSSYAPMLMVRTRASDDGMEIRIRDNGVGIAPDVLGKVYNPFFTTKPTGEGVGLGLSISHDIIVGHGGEIRVDSAEGEFTEFIVMIPWRIADRVLDSNMPSVKTRAG